MGLNQSLKSCWLILLKAFKFIRVLFYYVSMKFLADYVVRKQCPNGTLTEHTILFLKVLCAFLVACMLLSYCYPPIN